MIQPGWRNLSNAHTFFLKATHMHFWMLQSCWLAVRNPSGGTRMSWLGRLPSWRGQGGLSSCWGGYTRVGSQMGLVSAYTTKEQCVITTFWHGPDYRTREWQHTDAIRAMLSYLISALRVVQSALRMPITCWMNSGSNRHLESTRNDSWQPTDVWSDWRTPYWRSRAICCFIGDSDRIGRCSIGRGCSFYAVCTCVVPPLWFVRAHLGSSVDLPFKNRQARHTCWWAIVSQFDWWGVAADPQCRLRSQVAGSTTWISCCRTARGGYPPGWSMPSGTTNSGTLGGALRLHSSTKPIWGILCQSGHQT